MERHGYAPISVMPHYPPPGHNRGQHRGIDIETQAPCRDIFDVHKLGIDQTPYSFPTLDGG